jgi:hypothetical protein
MKERQRIIAVIVIVVLYNVVDRYLIHPGKGLTTSTVIISIGIASVVYIGLIYFFGRKHMN